MGDESFATKAGRSQPAAQDFLLQAAGNRTQLEDREEHRHDDAADHHTEEHDQQGLDQ